MSIALRSVIITLPKGIQKAPVSEINFATSILGSAKARMESKRMKIEEIDGDAGACEIVKPDGWLRGKKRRLDHLTWEEKLQRKKLKNRVAAQTSRDRKKAKLDELEDTVRSLREENDRLNQECAVLRTQNKSLIAENSRLKSGCTNCQGGVGCEGSTLGSAESRIYPLPQGGPTQSAQQLTPNAALIWKILTLYLLSMSSLGTPRETITSIDSKNLLKAFCERLPPKWKLILVEQMRKSQKIPLRNVTITKEWWGRHQKMWKPMQPTEA